MAEKELYGYLIRGTKHCRIGSSRFASLHSQFETGEFVIVHRFKVQRTDIIPIKAGQFRIRPPSGIGKGVLNG
jgi:hypothetical protein